MSRRHVEAIGLIVIGSEILDGRVQDAHVDTCRRLARAHRLPLQYVQILRDDPALITEQLVWAYAYGVPFFSCGGIGGTPDDHTRGCAAAATARALETHPDGMALLERRFGDREIPETVVRMVQFPAGSVLVPNPVNQIPGFSVGDGHFVPGFPQMAEPMMAWVLEQYYAPGPETVRYTMVLPGAREAYLTESLDALTADYPMLAISSLPRFTADGTEVELSLAGEATTAAQAFARLRKEMEALGNPYTITDAPEST